MIRTKQSWKDAENVLLCSSQDRCSLCPPLPLVPFAAQSAGRQPASPGLFHKVLQGTPAAIPESTQSARIPATLSMTSVQSRNSRPISSPSTVRWCKIGITTAAGAQSCGGQSFTRLHQQKLLSAPDRQAAAARLPCCATSMCHSASAYMVESLSILAHVGGIAPPSLLLFSFMSCSQRWHMASRIGVTAMSSLLPCLLLPVVFLLWPIDPGSHWMLLLARLM